MKIESIRLIFAACLFVFSYSATAQDGNPFIGTWDLDKEASNFSDAPVPSNMSRTYQDLGNGEYMYLVVTISEDGSIGGSSARYKYDNQENPIASLNATDPTTIFYRRMNEKTVEYIVRVNGRTSQIGAKTISPDGRVLTIAIQNINITGDVVNQILSFNRRR